MKLRTRHVVSMLIMGILLICLLPYAISLLKILFVTKHISIWRQLSLYQWSAIGAVVYLIIQKYLSKNIEWLEVLSHELTHAAVTMLSFKKVHSLSATEKQGGEVQVSGLNFASDVAMRLAPYCLPLFTYPLLMIRPLIDFHGRAIFDVLIGITLCFHIICFKKQTKSHQPDLNYYPKAFTYMYIITAHLMNFCIILVAFFPRYNVFSSFWRMVCSIWEQVMNFFM